MKNVNAVKSIVTGLFAVTVTSAAWAGLDRTLTVSDPDAEGNVTITLGDGGDANGQALIAAWAPADRGDDVNAWDEFRYVGKVKVLPTDTARTFALPENWRTRSGCVRFFLMEKNLPFPTYIAYATRPDVADGGLYINTGIKPDSTADITVKFSSPNMSGTPSMCPFGIMGKVYLFPKSSTEYYYDFFGAKDCAATSGVLPPAATNVFNESAPHGSDTPITVRLNRDGLFVDGYRHMTFDQSKITGSASDSPLSLFGRYGSWKQKGTTCSIYSATIVTNGVLARDLVPCQVTSGEVRMYDRVTGGYYSKAGTDSTASLKPGPEIDPVPSDAGVPASRSRTLVFAPTLTVVSNAKDKGTVVSISEGHDAGILMAVASKTDVGTTAYSDWTESFYAAKVAANENTVTVNLPRAWWRNRYQVRFVWKSIAGLPYDRELTYLHSDALENGCNKAYVQTGWRPSLNTKAEIKARTAKDVCAFGIVSYFYIFHNANDRLYAFFGDQSTPDGVSIPDPDDFVKDFHVWELDASGASVDNESIAAFSGAALTESTKGITVPFRANQEGNSISKVGDVEVAGAKFWDGDYLGLDLVPCEKDGVVGFYDRVRGTFNNGKKGGSFTAGETVVADGDALAWSPSVDLQWGMILFLK